MDIRQKIQSIGGFTTIDNNQIPTTIDREANAKVAVQDGQTVMLGGFISTDRSKSASGVPLLKDIPILGNLFRSTSKTLNRKELMGEYVNSRLYNVIAWGTAVIMIALSIGLLWAAKG